MLRLISRSKEPPSTAGLSLLVAATPPDAQLSLGTGSGYARRELGYAWDCLQKEAQELLSELLQPGESQGLRDFQTGPVLPKQISSSCACLGLRALSCERPSLPWVPWSILAFVR